MTVIAAASVACKTMVDGTLRVSFDVEPRDARAAFDLFGRPGTAAALAALKPGQPESEDDKNRRMRAQLDAMPMAKGGALAQLAGQWCANPEFRRWLASNHPGEVRLAVTTCRGETDEEIAAKVVRSLCRIVSRAELDHSSTAAERFNRLIRWPYGESIPQ